MINIKIQKLLSWQYNPSKKVVGEWSWKIILQYPSKHYKDLMDFHVLCTHRSGEEYLEKVIIKDEESLNDIMNMLLISLTLKDVEHLLLL